MRLADTNFPSEKNLEIWDFEKFSTFSENFLSVEIFFSGNGPLVRQIEDTK
jgi:hypothetical protein